MIFKMKFKLYFLVAICLFVASCHQEKEQLVEEQEPSFCLTKELKGKTEVISVNERPIYDELILTGKVEYNNNDLVAYKSLLDGTVLKVNFELGDYVKKGQVLAVVNSTEIQGLSQDKKAHQNQIALLKRQLKSKRELMHDEMASQTEVNELEFQLKTEQIEIDKINSTLSMYRAIGNGQFQILAPKNGYIVKKAISIGQTISTEGTEELFSISNLNQVWIMVNVYANDLKYIKNGDHVMVKTIADPNRVYSGKIDKIYHVIDEDEHVMKARVVLQNQDLNLIPGLIAEIIVQKQTIKGTAFAIPNSAKIFENNKEYIVSYKDDCTMEIKRITPITMNSEYTFINEKLKKNEKIIAKNALLIYEELNK